MRFQPRAIDNHRNELDGPQGAVRSEIATELCHQPDVYRRDLVEPFAKGLRNYLRRQPLPEHSRREMRLDVSNVLT
jgi:hypothetical protein